MTDQLAVSAYGLKELVFEHGCVVTEVSFLLGLKTLKTEGKTAESWFDLSFYNTQL